MAHAPVELEENLIVVAEDDSPESGGGRRHLELVDDAGGEVEHLRVALVSNRAR